MVLARLQREKTGIQTVDGANERGGRHGEIPDVGPVRTLAVVDALDDLRQQPVDIQVALAVAV